MQFPLTIYLLLLARAKSEYTDRQGLMEEWLTCKGHRPLLLRQPMRPLSGLSV